MPHESTGQRVAQPSTSLEHPRSPYHAFRSALQSMARLFERQLDEHDPHHTIKPSQLKQPRRQLEAPRPHVWPFELLLPTCIVSGKQLTPVRLDAAKSLTPQGNNYSKVHPEGLEVPLPMQPPEGDGEAGGVREEKTGYGVGWKKGGGDYYPEDTMNQSETGYGVGWKNGGGDYYPEDMMNQSEMGNVHRVKRPPSMETFQTEDGSGA